MRKVPAIAQLIILLAFAASLLQTSPVFAAANVSSATSQFTTSASPNIIIQPVQGPSVSKQLETRAKASWPWYITRAAGFVAAFSLVLLMLSGIGFITGKTFKFLEPLTAWATHKAVAYVFAISSVIHVVALLFDKYVPFTIIQILIPFRSNYREVSIAGHHLGSLYVALGILSLYCVLAIILTSILWIDKKPHTWKAFHFLAYLTIIFVFFHALFLGAGM